jgi:hypothetical protein
MNLEWRVRQRPMAMSAPWLAGAVALFAAFLRLHLPITDFFDGLARTYGFVRYNDMTRRAFLALAGAATVAGWWWAGRLAPVTGAATTLLVAVAGAAARLLTVVAIEAIHYPQYAVMAAVLARAGLSLEGAWIAATALGGLDEIYQFACLPRGRPTYFDWNDVVLNGIGAAFGCIAVRGWAAGALAPVLPRGRTAIALLVTAAVLVTVFPPLPPYFATTPGGQRFVKLNPSEAVALLIALWLGVRTFASARDRQ